jgi:hypothetical protein
MDETRPGRHPQIAPGVVIVVESRDGRQEQIIGPPALPVIEARPIENDA